MKLGDSSGRGSGIRRRTAVWLLLLLLGLLAGGGTAVAQTSPPRQLTVAPGDTWVALSWRFDQPVSALQAANPHPNRQREPAIGAIVTIPDAAGEQAGRLIRLTEGGLLSTAARAGLNPWQLALRNGLPSPYRPGLERPLFLPSGDQPPRDWPPGFDELAVSAAPAQPGQALGLRGRLAVPFDGVIRLRAPGVEPVLLVPFSRDGRLVAVAGTGGFYPAGDYELEVVGVGRSFWSQPWRFREGDWTFDRVTLTGDAAAIDQAAIAAERARLMALWSEITPAPLWRAPFVLPITNYVNVSSLYGARRSYNGGPFRTYHEGVDFAAYAGTPVTAPAHGVVVLAEQLYVRGGAVIIDHGWGIYSGYYHLSAVHAAPGQAVAPGDLLGEVGTTGLSSGNHLHWDLLVGGAWVDAAAWLEQDLACWLLATWGQPCDG